MEIENLNDLIQVLKLNKTCKILNLKGWFFVVVAKKFIFILDFTFFKFCLGNKIDDSNIDSITELLKINKTIKIINLKGFLFCVFDFFLKKITKIDNLISGKGIEMILNALLENKSVTNINFSCKKKKKKFWLFEKSNFVFIFILLLFSKSWLFK